LISVGDVLGRSPATDRPASALNAVLTGLRIAWWRGGAGLCVVRKFSERFPGELADHDIGVRVAAISGPPRGRCLAGSADSAPEESGPTPESRPSKCRNRSASRCHRVDQHHRRRTRTPALRSSKVAFEFAAKWLTSVDVAPMSKPISVGGIQPESRFRHAEPRRRPARGIASCPEISRLCQPDLNGHHEHDGATEGRRRPNFTRNLAPRNA